MTYDQIKELIRDCLLEIFYRDSLLLDRTVREESINHRLAFYFETIFTRIVHDDMFYMVDLEYNKNISRSDKEIELDNGQVISIRPDIIIHQRQDNNNNLLAVEAKLISLRNHDRQKMIKLLHPPFNYRYTAGIRYNPERSYFSYEICRLEKDEIITETFKLNKE